MRISVELPSNEEQMNGFEMRDQHNDQSTLITTSAFVGSPHTTPYPSEIPKIIVHPSWLVEQSPIYNIYPEDISQFKYLHFATLLNESPLRLVTEKTSSERYTGPLSALLSPLMFHSEDSSTEEESDSSDTEDDSITDLSSSSEDENSISSVEETSEKSKKQEPEKGLLESDNQDDGKVNNRNNERNQKTRL